MGWWRQLWGGGRRSIGHQPLSAAAQAAAVAALDARLLVLHQDPYLCLADPELRLLSVFDDLTYDRSDLDMLTVPMRRRAITALRGLGLQQVSGSVVVDPTTQVRFVFPKFQALGASPFDVARYLKRQAHDYLVLTPTQTACQIIDHHPFDEALERVKALLRQQPINIYRLLDYLEHKPAHNEFLKAIGHLDRVQGEAIAQAPLAQRKPL
ncbi:hypothetical protein [Marinicella meishanensis]|uniref:hypothetical protein n=1 Tax=Marinicella meishanensis TaxID=2873263 RepID=UPI001CC05813|nr:hypothetical protein [Marinicella sp. NBU2979]